jgi:hypothetical protein
MESKRMSAKQLVTRILLPGIALLLLLWACNAPSFPLPPPGPESMHFEQTSAGLVTMRGDPNDRIPPDSEITVLNKTLRVFAGCYADVDGSFECGPFYGDAGHLVSFTFTDPDNEKRGGSMCYVLGFTDPVVEDPRCGQ